MPNPTSRIQSGNRKKPKCNPELCSYFWECVDFTACSFYVKTMSEGHIKAHEYANRQFRDPQLKAWIAECKKQFQIGKEMFGVETLRHLY